MVSASPTPDARQQHSYSTFEQIREHRDLFDSAHAHTDCCGTAILDRRR